MITVTHDVVAEVMASLGPSWADAVRWLDDNCPAWRTGPAPRGRPVVVEVSRLDEDEEDEEELC